VNDKRDRLDRLAKGVDDALRKAFKAIEGQPVPDKIKRAAQGSDPAAGKRVDKRS
jgi:hypothetical protein